MYPPEVRELVLSVRPGITDDAAIEFSDESALLANAADPERVTWRTSCHASSRYYVDYVRNHTLAGDLRIIARTLRKLAKNGARGPA